MQRTQIMIGSQTVGESTDCTLSIFCTMVEMRVKFVESVETLLIERWLSFNPLRRGMLGRP